MMLSGRNGFDQQSRPESTSTESIITESDSASESIPDIEVESSIVMELDETESIGMF